MAFGSRLAMASTMDFRIMSQACEAASAINLGAGVCDLPTPASVAEGAIDAIQASRAAYTHPAGLESLRVAIAAKIERCYGLSYDPLSEVVVTPGAAGGFSASLLGLCSPGDEVILFEPYYGIHMNILLSMGLKPVLVPLRPPKWQLDVRELEGALSARTRVVLLCTPSNPSGKVWTTTELDLVADFCCSHDLTAITDEIYEHIVFEGATHVPIASRAGMRERTVTISGLSKLFSITGWRIGYLSAPSEAVGRIIMAQEMLSICAPTPLQYGALQGLSLPQDYFSALPAIYQKKRDILCHALRDAGLFPYVPAGSYYVLCDARRLGCNTSRAAAMRLLERAGVGSIAGTNFYRDPLGESLLRFCFAKSDEDLNEAATRLRLLA